MKIVDGIEVPETIGEAMRMNYQQLQKACAAFNNHGVSAEDIKRSWEEKYWEGFDNAIEFALNVISNSSYGTEDVALQIEDEVELYKTKLLGLEDV